MITPFRLVLLLAVAFLPSACDLTDEPARPGLLRSGEVMVMGTQYTEAGGMAALEVVGDSVARTLEAFDHSDLVLSSSGNQVFVIDRANATISAWRAGATAPLWQRSTGANSNPYDVAVVGDRAFVARYNSDALLVLGASTGDSVGRVDLGGHANDSTPNPSRPRWPDMVRVLVWNGQVLVVLQRLGLEGERGFRPTDTSLVVVVDPQSLSVRRVFPLQLRNPQSAQLEGNVLWLGSVGRWSNADWSPALDGGVEALDLAAGRSTVHVTESALGVNISHALLANGDFVVTGYTATFGTVLQRVRGGAVIDTMLHAEVGAVVREGDNLRVGHRSTDGRTLLLTFPVAGGPVTDSVSTRLLPTSAVLVP